MCVAVVFAACSTSPSPASSGAGATAPAAAASDVAQALPSLPAGNGSGACVAGAGNFCGHIKISGGVTRDSDFSSGGFAKSCAEWLKGNEDDPTHLHLPIALVADVDTDTAIWNYKGPGTYDVADLKGNLGGFQIVVASDSFVKDSKTTGSATVAADGSGSITATGMVPAGAGNKVQQPVDLSMTWTCNS